jgi:hypothetical protein
MKLIMGCNKSKISKNNIEIVRIIDDSIKVISPSISDIESASCVTEVSFKSSKQNSIYSF